MKALLATTEPFIRREETSLSADAVSGNSVSLDVVNSDGIAANDYVCVGFAGTEGAELCQVTSVTETTITVSTLALNHTANEPVTKYRYNKRKFYGATSSTGTYTELTADGSPADINVADPQGTYFEYTGTTYTYFKATYYNSTDNTETDIADISGTLADESKRYTSIYAIRKRAGLAGNHKYSDARIEQKRTQAENEINSAIAARYVLPLSEIPAIISNICETLAAGYIADEEFPDDPNSVKRLGEGRAILKAVANGSQRLLGSDYSELPRNLEAGRLDGFPNAVTTTTSTAGVTTVTSPVFSMDDQY